LTVFVYVEGRADELALGALLQRYIEELQKRGHGLKFVTLQDKRKFLRKIGPRAAARLLSRDDTMVVALPDLCPPIENPPNHAHRSLEELKQVLRRLVREGLKKLGARRARAQGALDRFYPSAFKHEMEMLLLAARGALSNTLHAEVRPSWRRPVEEQNCSDAGRPKRIVETLFRKHAKRRYSDTKDAPAILRRVRKVAGEVLYDDGQLQCPEFNRLLDWLGEKTSVPVYDAANYSV